MTPAAAGLPARAALAAGRHSARTTDLGERLLWVGALLVLVAAAYALMWRAWKRRAARQSDLPELPPLPPGPAADATMELTGRYHGSTTSGDWLDRIVARGLGTRSLVDLALTPAGIAVHRPGAASFLIPAEAVRGARLDKGIAGKVLTEGGLLVITWSHGGRLLDSGFRSDHPAEHPAWVTAVNALAEAAPPAGGTTRTKPSPNQQERPR